MIILPDDMYDAIPRLVGNIPTDAYAVAGYVDSISFTWSRANWDRFPNSLHCTITTTGRVKAHFADRETGDLSPQQVYDLYQSGSILGVYCNYASWQAVQDVFNTNGKPQPPYWIAQYPGGGRVMPSLDGITAIAHQYYSSNLYDKSAITDSFVALIGGHMTDPLSVALPRMGTQEDGSPQTGTTTLGTFVEWFDSNVAYLARKIDAVPAAVAAAVQSEITAEQAALLAAIKAQPTGGQVDVTALATSLAPTLAKLLPQSTPAEVGAAVEQALAAQFAK